MAVRPSHYPMKSAATRLKELEAMLAARGLSAAHAKTLASRIFQYETSGNR